MRLSPFLILAVILAGGGPIPADAQALGEGPALPDGATDEAAAPAPPEAEPEPDAITTGAVTPELSTNLRVRPEGAVDTSDPASGFLAGNVLRRTLADDPYAPLGIRTGSFIWYPSVDLATGYTTNATNTASGKGAGFAIVAPELLVRSDWSRHEATLALRGSYETFTDGAAANRPAAEVEATTRLDFAELWTAAFNVRYDYGRESVSDPDYPEGVDRDPDVHQLAGSAALNGGAGRVRFTIEGRADRTDYADATADGKVVDQSDRNNTVYGGRLRLGYALTPTLTPFVEGELSERVYDRNVDDNGIDRTTHGDALRAGFAFDRSPVSRGEVALGYERADFDDPALATLAAFTVDGSLIWSPTGLVTVTTNLSTGIDPSTDPDSSGSIVYDASIDIAYAWRENVILDALASLKNQEYQGNGQDDWTYQVGFATTWRLNRSLHLKAGYVHEWLDSSAAGRDYASDTIRFDLRLQH